ncbi:hypothetical protein [Paraliomyxa miuraensis]|uniref:hypothetical protein n=1 Tax=Paraliomyxa miuraensis TaxID=376150 RepID=UPI00225BA1AF|nr:hypothetical protein [Paraliomyxa miuraensis]MCX4246964.1 hypothetical protein [Paraliomyxa miuraensis]
MNIRAAISCSCLLAVLACNEQGTGDDLPPGAFTSGLDGDPDVGEVSSDTSSGDASSSTTSASATSTTTPADTSSGDLPTELSYESHIHPIWMAQGCLDPSCHDSEAPAAGFDLQSAGAYDRLCANNSAVITNINLIDCDGLDPDESWVYRKVTGDIDLPGAGSLMPIGGMLTAGELATLEAWIIGGALP